MKNLKEFILEDGNCCGKNNKKTPKKIKSTDGSLVNDNEEEEEVEKKKDDEETISNEKEFRAAAKAKFETAFGDELDKKRMDFTIDGFLKNNKELVDKGDWAQLIGMLNASFAK